MVNKKFFTIEETARHLGISKQTLVRYENRGVFPKPHRNPINRWRQYTSEDIERLNAILRRGR
jgi:DNA-binding transcriptional MerR regulator